MSLVVTSLQQQMPLIKEMRHLKTGSIIAAIRNESEFDAVLSTEIEVIFDLCADLLTLSARVEKAHLAKRKFFIHFDLATGIAKDKSGMRFAKIAGVDGIISTRANIIKLAREEGLFTVQRFFILDSQSVSTTVESLRSSKADMIEIMPGVIPKIIKNLKTKISIPIIAGGLIETEDEVRAILNSGATAVSTGNPKLWKDCEVLP